MYVIHMVYDGSKFTLSNANITINLFAGLLLFMIARGISACKLTLRFLYCPWSLPTMPGQSGWLVIHSLWKSSFEMVGLSSVSALAIGFLKNCFSTGIMYYVYLFSKRVWYFDQDAFETLVVLSLINTVISFKFQASLVHSVLIFLLGSQHFPGRSSSHAGTVCIGVIYTVAIPYAHLWLV